MSLRSGIGRIGRIGTIGVSLRKGEKKLEVKDITPKDFNDLLIEAMDKTEINLEHHSGLFRVGYMKARTDLLIYAASVKKKALKGACESRKIKNSHTT